MECKKKEEFFVQESDNLSHEVTISQPHSSRGVQIEPEDKKSTRIQLHFCSFPFMTLLLLMFPFHDGYMFEWNFVIFSL